MRRVLDRVRADGPVQARDFEAPAGSSGGWWEWKPAKQALEQLFMEGQLMVAGRRGFQKVYDLPENMDINYRYVYDNLETVNRRLLQAGIRLAGILNKIYG